MTSGYVFRISIGYNFCQHSNGCSEKAYIYTAIDGEIGHSASRASAYVKLSDSPL